MFKINGRIYKAISTMENIIVPNQIKRNSKKNYYLSPV